MRFYLISDNADTQMGMRLAGIEGVVVHGREETEQALRGAMADSGVAVVLMTEKLVSLCRDMVYKLKLTMRSPLIVEIPDRHGTSDITASIARYVEDAIGINIDN